MGTELSVHPGAPLHCPDVSACLGLSQYERDEEGSWADPVAMVFLQQLLPQFPHSQGDLEGGFGRGWLVLWCVPGEVILPHLTGNWKGGRGSQNFGYYSRGSTCTLTSQTTVS